MCFFNATGLAFFFFFFLVFFSFVFLLWTLLRWNQNHFFFFFFCCVFGPKFSDGVMMLFSSHLRSLQKNPRPKATSRHFSGDGNYGISVPSLFVFFFPLLPLVAQCRRSSSSSVDHQMDFWSLLYTTECVRQFNFIVKLWILGNIFDCGRGHWMETDVCITT